MGNPNAANTPKWPSSGTNTAMGKAIAPPATPANHLPARNHSPGRWGSVVSSTGRLPLGGPCMFNPLSGRLRGCLMPFLTIVPSRRTTRYVLTTTTHAHRRDAEVRDRRVSRRLAQCLKRARNWLISESFANGAPHDSSRTEVSFRLCGLGLAKRLELEQQLPQIVGHVCFGEAGDDAGVRQADGVGFLNKPSEFRERSLTRHDTHSGI